MGETKKKDVCITVRLDPDKRAEFNEIARLKGSNPGVQIREFIYEKIREWNAQN